MCFLIFSYEASSLSHLFRNAKQELITRAPITKQFTEIFEIYPCEVIWLIFETRNMKYLNYGTYGAVKVSSNSRKKKKKEKKNKVESLRRLTR